MYADRIYSLFQERLGASTMTEKTGVREAMQRLVRDNKRLQNAVEELQRETEIAREELVALRLHNARLASASFMLMAWQNDTLAVIANGEGEVAETAGAWIERFSALQADVAPETFRRFYGIDPFTGAELGSGVLTDGEVSGVALETHLEDVPVTADDANGAGVRTGAGADAGEMGRAYLDGGALDNK